jgi:hypothetical protein
MSRAADVRDDGSKKNWGCGKTRARVPSVSKGRAVVPQAGCDSIRGTRIKEYRVLRNFRGALYSVGGGGADSKTRPTSWKLLLRWLGKVERISRMPSGS